jgi:hypothetical protein
MVVLASSYQASVAPMLGGHYRSVNFFGKETRHTVLTTRQRDSDLRKLHFSSMQQEDLLMIELRKVLAV